MSYYGIQRNKPDDEICHFKYIDRYKKNGKWQYVYEESKNKVGNAKSALKTNLSNAKTTVKKAAYNAVGGKKKDAYVEATKKYEKVNKVAQDANAKALESASKEGRAKNDQNTRVKAANSRDALNRFGNSGKLGGSTTTVARTEKIAQKQAEKLRSTTDKHQAEMNKAYDERSKALREKNETKQAYEETALYKYEKASEKGKAAVDKLNKKVYDAAGGKRKAEMEDALTKTEAASKAASKAWDKWKEEDTAEAQGEYYDVREKADKAAREYAEAERRYRNSPIGMYDTVVKPAVEQRKKKRRS